MQILDGPIIEFGAPHFEACAIHAAEITSSMIISEMSWAVVEQAVGFFVDQTQAGVRWTPIQ